MLYITTDPFWFGIERREPSLEAAARAASLNPRGSFAAVILEAAAEAAFQIEATKKGFVPARVKPRSEVHSRVAIPGSAGIDVFRLTPSLSPTPPPLTEPACIYAHVKHCFSQGLVFSFAFWNLRAFLSSFKKESFCINAQD